MDSQPTSSARQEIKQDIAEMQHYQWMQQPGTLKLMDELSKIRLNLNHRAEDCCVQGVDHMVTLLLTRAQFVGKLIEMIRNNDYKLT